MSAPPELAVYPKDRRTLLNSNVKYLKSVFYDFLYGEITCLHKKSQVLFVSPRIIDLKIKFTIRLQMVPFYNFVYGPSL